ncbi:RHS repeat-associated core domain-containing protein [Chromatiaceae bacterium AAb-1]|nr:RHS repeat-associated core domain-containing protein [Chromatiaceae bacterium AAb-1]
MKPVTTRGFTGHEQLDEMGLIHMNGRAYDYNLGRFLSVDPFIQSPGNSQSLNPYSYIMNNPLAGTDPTGYVGCAASKIEVVCDKTVSRWGGNGNADMTAFATSSGVASNQGNGARSVQPSQGSAGGHTADIGSQNSLAAGLSGIDGALISKHVYGKGGNLPDGISQLSNERLEEMGLADMVFNDAESGFQSGLYYDSNHRSYIYALAGTNDGADMAENFAQGVGNFAMQYDLALRNTAAIKASVGGALTLAGHSLGGGLASMAAALNGLPANTYNAAGVHMNTLARYSGGMASAVRLANSANVNAYHVIGDGLTRMQRYSTFAPAVPSAIGRPVVVQPANPVWGLVPFYGGVKLHSIDTVIDSMR